MASNVQIQMKMRIPLVNPKNDFARSALVKGVESEIRQIEKMFDRLTGQSESFSNTFWDMEIDVGTSITGMITTTSTPFVYVSGGTDKRHARMSERYKPRTQPGSLKMGPHSGGPIAVSRKIQKRGVKARNFHGQIAEKRRAPFTKRMEKIVSRLPVFTGFQVRVLTI